MSFSLNLRHRCPWLAGHVSEWDSFWKAADIILDVSLVWNTQCVYVKALFNSDMYARRMITVRTIIVVYLDVDANIVVFDAGLWISVHIAIQGIRPVFNCKNCAMCRWRTFKRTFDARFDHGSCTRHRSWCTRRPFFKAICSKIGVSTWDTGSDQHDNGYITKHNFTQKDSCILH